MSDFFCLVVEAMNTLIKLTVTNRGCEENLLELCEQIGEMVS